MEEKVLVIILAFLIDCLIGDPQNPIHPIRIIGKFINLNLILYRKLDNRNKIFSFIFGVFTSLSTIILFYILTKIIINLFLDINIYLGFIIQVVLCYTIIAPKALKEESMKVYKSLKKEDLEEARKNLSYIVGRDTRNLSYKEIIKATVETIGENLSDGVIAPIIYVFIGGVPLGICYKAINTLDSMIGYRNETFEYFGKFAAKLDDVVNFIPSRITALLMIFSTLFIGENTKEGIRIYKRDRLNHKSPNSAQTESVCAGVLGIQLGGDNYYNGKLVHKDTIGDNINEPVIDYIIRTNRLMYGTTILTIVIMGILVLVF